MDFGDVSACVLHLTPGQSAQRPDVLPTFSKHTVVCEFVAVQTLLGKLFRRVFQMYLNKQSNTLPPNTEGVGERH